MAQPQTQAAQHREQRCRYTRGGLIEQAFYIQIANAILPEVTDLLNPFAFLTSHILARYMAQPSFSLQHIRLMLNDVQKDAACQRDTCALPYADCVCCSPC